MELSNYLFVLDIFIVVRVNRLGNSFNLRKKKFLKGNFKFKGFSKILSLMEIITIITIIKLTLFN